MQLLKDNKIIQALLVVAVVWLIIRLSPIVLLMFIAFLVTVVLHPTVVYLRRHHFPVGLAVFMPLLGLMAVLALVGFFIVPPLVVQVRHFIGALPSYLNRLPVSNTFSFDFKSLRNLLQGHFGTIGNALIVFTSTALQIVVGFITVVVVSIYWLATYGRNRKTLLTYLPPRYRGRVRDIWDRAETKISSWALAQLLMSLIVGTLVGVGSWLIGLPFPVVFGLISFFLELIPAIGPIIATIPGAAIGFAISFKTGLFAVLLHILVQQFENHVLAPLLLGRTVKLHPIIIILSLLVGSSLYGILGALLAVPAALVISSVVDSFRDEPVPS